MQLNQDNFSNPDEKEDYIKSLELSVQFLQDEIQNLRRDIANYKSSNGINGNSNAEKLEIINFHNYTDNDEIVLKLHNTYQQLFGLVESNVYILLSSGDYFPISDIGTSTTIDEQLTSMLEEGVIDFVAETKIPNILPNLQDESGFPTNFIIIPLIIRNDLWGLFVGKTIRERDSFNQFEIKEIAQSAENAAIALDNIRITQEISKLNSRMNGMNEQMLHYSNLASIGELSASIAREIEVPIAVINGHLNLLETGVGDPIRRVEIIREQVEKISLFNSRLNKLASDDPNGTSKEVLSLKQIIEDAKFITESQLAQFDTSIVSVYESDNLSVMGNKTQLEQVLLNLIYNARDAMQDGGIIEIGVYKHGKNKVSINIADQGSGIKEENLANIFEPFFSTKNEDKKMGIGLYLSRTIINQHNGTINVASILGKGSTFKIVLPLVNE